MISQNMLPFPVADALLYISLVLLVALSIKRLIQRPVDRPVTVRLPSQLSATT
jgi:branched-subunit amino acid transport protein